MNLPSQHFSQRTRAVRYIVLHTTQGTDSRSWLQSNPLGVSAHYLEREDDEYAMVDEAFAAHHAGEIVARNTPTGRPTTPLYTGQFLGFAGGREVWSVNPNDESIGIEAEGFAATLLSPTIIGRVASRIRRIRDAKGPLPLVDHSQLSPGNRSDPGAQNRAAIVAALEEEDDMREEDFKRIEDMVESKLVAVEKRVLTAVKDYNPLIQVGRRIVRSLRGNSPPARDPGTAYPDDTSPIT